MAKQILPILLLIVSLLFPTLAEAQKANSPIQLPTVPEQLHTPAERASYLVKHYWDNFSFTDSMQYMNCPDVAEQAVVNYIDLFRLVPTAEAEASLFTVMDQASCTLNGFLFFYNTFEKYLYDLSSPMRNEALFIPVLQKMIASDRLSADDKIRPEMLLKSVSKNRIGSPAADFTYTLADGNQQTLCSITSKWTLLLFFDPDCDECHQAILALQNSSALNKHIEQKQLTVLAVYPDNNLHHWKIMLPNLPKNWIIAYDKSQAIYEKELYDILGFPTIFLLDCEKNVVLKDASPEEVESYFDKK